jgi:addiction module HigA family antidote
MEDVRAGKVDLRDVVDTGTANPLSVTPGEILQEEFMRPLGLSARRLAEAIGVPVNRVTQIIRGQRAITASTALRLARYFDTSPELWLNLQTHFELRRAAMVEGEAIRREVQPRAGAA